MTIVRGLATAVILAGGAVTWASPAAAINPIADGTFTYSQEGAVPATWRAQTLCTQPSGPRNPADYQDETVFAQNCYLHLQSTTPSTLTREERLQNFTATGRLSNGRWTVLVKQPEGVLCADGSTAPSEDSYAVDDATLTGMHTTIYGAVCGAKPGMMKKPFTLSFLGPLPDPVERYPLICDAIARCY